MKTPTFWYPAQPVRLTDRIAAVALSPLALLYGWVSAVDRAIQGRAPYPAKIPVICVGNINAGGSGKTPTALALGEMIKDTGVFKNPYYVTKGYGGFLSGPLCLAAGEPSPLSTQATGDEAQLLCRTLPTVIAKNWVDGIRHAENLGADCIITDDGLLNRGFEKDLRIMVVDGHYGFGNGRTIPAGPLRRPLKGIEKIADIAVVIDGDIPNLPVPVIPATITVQAPELSQTDKVLAFCGIALPGKFQATLQKLGISPKVFKTFPDHHVFGKSDMDALFALAKADNLTLLTTEKDWVRLGSAERDIIKTVNIKIQFENKPLMRDSLSKLKQNPAQIT